MTSTAEQTEGARRLNILINGKGLDPRNLARALDIRDADGGIDVATLLAMSQGVIPIPDEVLAGLRRIHGKYTHALPR